MKIVNLAIIGGGVMGSNHARVCKENPCVNLQVICDNNIKKAKESSEKFSTKYSADYKQIDLKGLDGVIIATPTSSHKEIAEYFIKNKLNVLVEKPLALTYKDSVYLTKLAKNYQKELLVGHIERFNPAIAKLDKLINSEKLGDIVTISTQRVGIYPPRVSDVDVITDIGIHDIDIACHLLGKFPDYVYARGGSAILGKRVDYADIFLAFDSNACHVQVNWLTPVKIRKLFVTGTKGYAQLDYIKQTLNFAKTKYSKRIPKGFSDFVVNFYNSNLEPIPITKEEPLKREINHFVDCIMNDSDSLVNGYDAAKAIKITEIALRSIRTGDKLRVNG